MTTMTDVAKAADVSVQTISAVINGKSGISEATRERVLRVIEELDYHPNQLASSLRSQRNSTIGILIPNIANPYWPEMVRGAEDVAHSAGFAVFLCNTDGDQAKLHTYIRLLRRHRVAGLFCTVEIDAKEVRRLLASKIHVAVNGSVQSHEQAVAITVDDRQGGYVATTHLIDLGHRRIAIAAPLNSPGTKRRAGYVAALQEQGIDIDPDLQVSVDFDVPGGQQAGRSLMQLPSPPTAIIAGNDLIAIGIITVVKRLGRRVPEDVAVVGFDNIPMAALYDPPLTTIAQPLYEMGAYAMQAILDRVQDPTLGGATTIFPTPLIVRRSTVMTAGYDEDLQPGAVSDVGTAGAGLERHPAYRKEVPIG